MNSSLPFWPIGASVHADRVDWLFAGMAALLLLLAMPVFVLLFVWTLKYRRGTTADRSGQLQRTWPIETAWTIIPFLLVLVFFVYGAFLYLDLGRPPADSLAIHVVAKQWMWKFEHPGGQREIDDLHVPQGQDVMLSMTSQDVIHSFFVPELRIKQDVLPGRYTSIWFNADRTGTFALRCSQFCGLDHSEMIGRLVVQTPADYARWLEQAGTSGTLADQGKALFQSLGCAGCHEGQSSVRAPSLVGIYGRPVPLQGGRTVTADDQYLRDSILDPNRDVVAGYQPQMPTFAGQVTEDQLIQLKAYIKSLGGQPKEPGT